MPRVTIWSTNRYSHGRLGSFFHDGFTSPLLLQIADDLRTALPRVIGDRHRLRQAWGFKDGCTLPGRSTHADFAAVNVNFWVTPDDANLDDISGGPWSTTRWRRWTGTSKPIIAAAISSKSICRRFTPGPFMFPTGRTAP